MLVGMFKNLKHRAPTFRHDINHLEFYYTASVCQIVSHACCVLTLFQGLELHPMCKSVPTLILEKISHLEIKL